MMDKIKILWTNLEKWQRVVAVVILQGIFILIIAATLNFVINSNRNRIDIIDDSDQTASMPVAAKDSYEDALWNIIKNNVDNVGRSVIKDARIRDGSYKEETVNDDGVVQASFIVDIDSIKQTYRVVISWDKNGSNVTEAIVDCPAVSESKYPDSFCRGTYRDTDDLSLYLPYFISAPHDSEVVDVSIDGDESEHKIYVDVANCQPERLKQKAMEYLKSTPIDLSKYEIVYDVYNLEYPYFDEEKLSESEINDLMMRCESE